jgi:hypothetical protein
LCIARDQAEAQVNKFHAQIQDIISNGVGYIAGYKDHTIYAYVNNYIPLAPIMTTSFGKMDMSGLPNMPGFGTLPPMSSRMVSCNTSCAPSPAPSHNQLDGLQ